MKLIIFIGGVSGIGKTSLIKKFCSNHPEYRSLSSSDFINPCAQPNFFTQFDTLTYEERTDMRTNATKGLRGMAAISEGALLIDGHFSCFNRHTKEPEMCFTPEDGNLYTQLILLNSNAESVLKRREQDMRQKHYSSFTLKDINHELAYEREIAEEISKNYGLSLRIINTDQTEERESDLLRLIEH